MNFNKVNNYIEDLYSAIGSLNKKTFINQTNTKDFIPVVDEDVARLLQLLIKVKMPMRILEIGTSIGYSTTSMAKTVQEYGGEITTIEFDEIVAYHAKENFIKAGVDNVIDLRIGDAREIIPNLTDTYDMIFQDVDKNLYPLLFNDCIRLLNKGGLLLAEDTLFPVLELDSKWWNLVEPIKEFNKLVIDCRQLESTILPIGDGVTVAIKL